MNNHHARMGRHLIESVESIIASARASVEGLRELSDELGPDIPASANTALTNLETSLLAAKSDAATVHDEMTDIETTNNLNSGGGSKSNP